MSERTACNEPLICYHVLLILTVRTHPAMGWFAGIVKSEQDQESSRNTWDSAKIYSLPGVTFLFSPTLSNSSLSMTPYKTL